MAKVSIIIPIYNSEKYLNRCLDSLVNQTLEDIEIITVNDGSTDKSEEIIKSYMDDKRIIFINKKNGGQASARNLGLTKANGDYIIFIDSDDYTNLDMCEKAYKAAQNMYDIVCMDYYTVKGDNKKYFKILDDKQSGEISVKEYLFSSAGPCNKMYSKKFLLENGFAFPEGITYEDYAAIPSLGKYNPKVYYLNYANFYYVFHESSTMQSKIYKSSFEDIFKATDFLYNNLINTNLKEELEFLIIHHLLYLGSLNFYKYRKFNQIDRIAEYMRVYFPKWRKNKYMKKFTKKEKLLLYLFYHRKYRFILLGQKIKRCIK